MYFVVMQYNTIPSEFFKLFFCIAKQFAGSCIYFQYGAIRCTQNESVQTAVGNGPVFGLPQVDQLLGMLMLGYILEGSNQLYGFIEGLFRLANGPYPLFVGGICAAIQI